MSANLKAIILLVVFILVSIVGLNYFGALPFSKTLPFFSFLPTSSGLSSCVVVEEKFCSQAERVMVALSSGGQFEYIGFRNLPPGTPIYAPVDGFFAASRESGPQSPIAGFSVRTADKGSLVKGKLRLASEIQRDVKAGNIAGYTTGEKILENYDFLITISESNPNGPAVVEDDLRKLFPAAFKRPAKQVSP